MGYQRGRFVNGRERAEGKEEGRDNDRTLSPPSDGREGARKFKLERRNPRHLGD